MDRFPDFSEIETLLSQKGTPSLDEIRALLDKARRMEGLTPAEVALLIRGGTAGDALSEILAAAGEVKTRAFGSRIVLFAPLYLTNDCINNCLYCGFRRDNEAADRSSLTLDEVVAQAALLEKMGFNRLLLVAGESPKYSTVEKIAEVVRAIYDRTKMRIVHVNAAPMETADLKRLKAAGVGVFQVFQETYHEETYRRMHPSGPKKDFTRRLFALDRAMEAGFGDVGVGALLGLYDWRFEVLALVAHAHHLFERFGAWPHTISVPRLRPATGSPITAPPAPVSDDQFRLIVALYRLAVPAAGVVVTTREPARFRDSLLATGASQISAGSRTDPGGYSQMRERFDASQFKTDDHRTLEEVVAHVAATGSLPSLCTACYRVGRTGSRFTEQMAAGGMEQNCLPNALLTLKEYCLDHANGSAPVLNDAIEKALSSMEDKKLREATQKKLAAIETGERDLFF